ncbi:RNA polymerase subunit sigma-70 [Micromonospora echinaurantiaca]|uniref:RNA polymerase subunit sigma-70 n=1 Tax=Micromonospora echinaurantiaca TaxID=47857 RepID=UPI003789159E
MSSTRKLEAEVGDLDLDGVLAAARAGDEDAFRALVAPHLRALHVHCYRMLGSYADAEEAVQEATVRAWRGLAGYQGTGPLRHWLYRIATTTCLKLINRRGREPLASTAEVAWLQPYPDVLLDQLTDDDADPAAVVERRESVALAFMAALQLLPATQRAVLILREVLDWPAREVADLLDTTVAGVNSALQRARATLAVAPTVDPHRGRLSRHEQRVLDDFLRAWHARDIPALAALLRDDIALTMPPQAIRIVGRDAVARFFATVPANGRLDRVRLVVTRANGHPALAAYLPDNGEWDCRGYGIMVLTIIGEQVATITGFPDPDLFPMFDLHVTTR